LKNGISKKQEKSKNTILKRIPILQQKIVAGYVPDFSVRQKKIPSHICKMDIYWNFKNVQNKKITGSFKTGVVNIRDLLR
jgi:hypothetical protein